MNILSALVLYAVVSFIVFVTLCVVVCRSKTKKKTTGILAGFFVSILWLPSILVLMVMVFVSKPEQNADDFEKS